MDDPTDYYFGIGIVVILLCCFSGISLNMIYKACRQTDFDNVYIETENDPI